MNTVFISLDNTAEGVDVGYEIKWRDPWEPFFISPRTAPDYDERFKQVRTSTHSSLSTSWEGGCPCFPRSPSRFAYSVPSHVSPAVGECVTVTLCSSHVCRKFVNAQIYFSEIFACAVSLWRRKSKMAMFTRLLYLLTQDHLPDRNFSGRSNAFEETSTLNISATVLILTAKFFCILVRIQSYQSCMRTSYRWLQIFCTGSRLLAASRIQGQDIIS